MLLSVPIDVAMRDPDLIGAALGDPTPWETWIAVVKAAFGNELSRTERRAFASVAGSRKPPTRRVQELWAIVGRRGGKSRVAAALATYLACFTDHAGKLAKGETGYVLVLAASVGQAQSVFRYIRGFVQASPLLRQLVESETASEIRLAANIAIAVHPNSFRTVRGRTLLACIFDESGFWRDETSSEPDLETYRAVLPALASTTGLLIAISSPYRRAGLLHNRHRDFFGVSDPDVLVIQGATEIFNPTIDRKVVARARAADPEAAMAEWDAQFRSDLAALLDDATIEGAIDRSRPMELPPREGIRYHAFIDPSGGRHDSFALCIGHGGPGEGFVADVVRARRAPFDPESVLREYAELAKQYHCGSLVSDAYAAEWVAQSVRAADLEHKRADMARSGLYLEAVAPFMRGSVSLPAHPILIRELKLLQRRTARSGKDAVDHPVGGTDDAANAVCGCMRSVLKPVVDHDEPPSVGVRVYTGRSDFQFGGDYEGRYREFRSPGAF